MTGKQRVELAVNHIEADRIPRYDSFWLQTEQSFLKDGLDKKLKPNRKIAIDGLERTIGDPLRDYFDFDFDVLYMDTSLRMECETLEESGEYTVLKDRYGFTVKKFKDKTGSMHFIDHATKDIENWDRLKNRMVFDASDTSRIDSLSYFMHHVPYPTWEGFKKIYDEYRKRRKYILYACYGVWEGTWRHHGFEETMMDAALRPDKIAEMFQYHTDMVIDTAAHAIKIGAKPDGIWLIEDLGGTHTTLISERMYVDLVMPYHKAIADFCHENGIKLFMHSCGFIESFIPYFIDAGLDVLQAIQANTGMNVVSLKEKYGHSLAFFGNIGVTKLSGTKKDIYEEVESKIPYAKKGGGYIYHSDHSISDDISLESYEYLMSLLDKFGSYRT